METLEGLEIINTNADLKKIIEKKEKKIKKNYLSKIDVLLGDNSEISIKYKKRKYFVYRKYFKLLSSEKYVIVVAKRNFLYYFTIISTLINTVGIVLTIFINIGFLAGVIPLSIFLIALSIIDIKYIFKESIFKNKSIIKDSSFFEKLYYSLKNKVEQDANKERLKLEQDLEELETVKIALDL